MFSSSAQRILSLCSSDKLKTGAVISTAVLVSECVHQVIMLVIISTALILAVMVAAAIIHMCVLWRAFEGGSMSNFSCRNFTKGLSAGELKKLPFYEYKGRDEGNGSEAECVICLDGFQVGDRCRLLPICRHSFHANCVDYWLKKTATCPICRSRVRESISGSVSSNQPRDLSSGREEFELQEIRIVQS